MNCAANQRKEPFLCEFDFSSMILISNDVFDELRGLELFRKIV